MKNDLKKTKENKNMMETDTARKSLNDLVSLHMPLTRIKGIIDHFGLNHDEQIELDRLKETKKEMRKRGMVPESEGYAEYESEDFKKAEEAFKQWKANVESMKKADEETRTKLEAENERLAATPGTQTLIDIQIQTQSKTRISKEASIALGCALQKILENLRDFCVAEAGKNNVSVVHTPMCFSAEDLSGFSYRAFVNRLGSWKDAQEKFYVQEDWEEENKAKIKELKAQAKTDGRPWKEAKELPEYKAKMLAPPVVEAYVPTYSANTDATFLHYAEKIFKELRRAPTADVPNPVYNEATKDMMFGKDFKIFSSNLVMDFLEKVNPLIEISLRCRKIKTVTEDVIKDVLEMIATIDNSRDILPSLFGFIDEKLGLYRDAEKAKKAAKEARANSAATKAPAPAAAAKAPAPAEKATPAPTPVVEAPAPGTQNRPARRRRRGGK